MERSGGAYAAVAVGLALVAYVTHGVPRIVFGVASVIALALAAWIGLFALGVALLLRGVRGVRQRR